MSNLPTNQTSPPSPKVASIPMQDTFVDGQSTPMPIYASRTDIIFPVSTSSWFWTFLVVTGVCCVLLSLSIFLIVSTPNVNMGLQQKIFYFHVPCAWVMFLATFVSGISSIFFLFRNMEKAEMIAKSSAALVVLFGACVLVTGPLWGRKEWGVFWKWDVHLTTSLLLWILFFMYFVSYRYAGPAGKKLAAALAIFSMLDVPLIYFSVSLFRGQHPETSVVRTLDSRLQAAFWCSFISMTLLFFILFWLRYRLLHAEQRRKALIEKSYEVGLLDETETEFEYSE